MEQKHKRKAGNRGSLQIVVLFLLASALLRIGGGTGQALARNPDMIEAVKTETDQAKLHCETSEDLQIMLDAFRAREDRLTEQETSLASRMQIMTLADEEISKKLVAMEEAERQLKDLIALADTAAEDDIGKLTRVYETMKPKQAASLFEEMDPNFAVGFLGRMRPEAAAAIMAGLNPETAHLFSVVLAGRNASIPTE